MKIINITIFCIIILTSIYISLVKTKRKTKNRQFLLFTSAGDKHNVQQWIGPSRRYDIIVIYYGNYAFTGDVELVIYNKDTKFPNLKMFLSTNHYDTYDAIAVWDDDIRASVDDINTLFDEMILHNADIYSPCHTRGSFESLLKGYTRSSRRVDFVEMNAPMFTSKTLLDFVQVFDKSIKGWGTDIWYSHLCMQVGCNMRVSDKVCVTNPETRADGTREVVNEHIQEQTWRNFAINTLHIAYYPPHSSYIKNYDRFETKHDEMEL